MPFLTYELDKSVLAFTTLRGEGSSQNTYKSNNFAYHVGDEQKSVIKNRKKLCDSLGILPDNLVLTYQTHSTLVAKVTDKDLGKGRDDFESGVKADALYTYDPTIALGIFHADCLPVFFYAEDKKFVGIIHAGLKGSIKEITYKVITYLKETELINPKQLKIALGPCISVKHTLIDDGKEQTVKELGYADAIEGNNLNLKTLNIMQLKKAGVLVENILISQENNDLLPELFYSVYNVKETGRNLSVIKFNY